MSDNITQAFLYHVDQYSKEAIIFADKKIAEEKKNLNLDQDEFDFQFYKNLEPVNFTDIFDFVKKNVIL